jgi:starch phosphorylase
VNFVRERQRSSALRRQASAAEMRHTEEVLDPNALTIGFARRFATYKRATLLFRDVDRIKRILCNKDMPVQIVIAGKAHPRDNEGKNFIRDIVQLSRDRDLWKHVVFVEDYDMKIAREMVQGVDLWLNTPKRGQEACGTSGMKAGMNGVLNLSILDGWFDEAYEFSGGWAIGDREPYTDEQDGLHASEIYYLLESEIVPLFYERRDTIPREWFKRVKQSLKALSPLFDSRRMVTEYASQFYDPAHTEALRLTANGFQAAREAARWNKRVREVWDKVRFVETGPAPEGPIMSERPVAVRTAIDLAGLQPTEVRVEVVMGRVGTDGGLEDTEVLVLPPTGLEGSLAIFEKEIVLDRTGRLGYALRISPNHCDDPLTRPCTSLLKWSDVPPPA